MRLGVDVEAILGYSGIMKTTIDIPESVLEEAMRHAKATTKREAVLRALEEYNRLHRVARLADHIGTVDGLMTREELDRFRADGDDPSAAGSSE